MISRNLTVVTPHSLRNQFVGQEVKLVKANGSYLTTLNSVTLATFPMLVSIAMPMLAFSQVAVHPCLNPYDIATQQTLQAPCEQVLENAPLEALLDSISSAYEIPIWCDRRIARDTIVSVERKDESLESFLNRAIAKVDAVLIPLAGVVLIVPKSKSDGIEAAYWRLMLSRSAGLFRSSGAKRFGWPDGTVAAKILDDFASRCAPDARLSFTTEHDIWRAFEFSKNTTPAAIGTCLLSGFDLCLAEDEGRMRVIPIDESNTRIDWTYSRDEVEKRIGERASKTWRQHWPEATISKSNKPDGWRVSATVSSHRDLIRPLIPQKKWQKPKPSEIGLDKKGFSGALEGELELVLKSLAAQTKLDFYPIPLPPSLESIRVKLKLDKTPLDEILKEITKQCGVHFRRDGERVEIIPK